MKHEVIKKIFGDKKHVRKDEIVHTFEHIYGITIEDIDKKLQEYKSEKLTEKEIREFIDEYNEKQGYSNLTKGYRRFNPNDYKGYQEIVDTFVGRCQNYSKNLKKLINENEFCSVVKTNELCKLYTGLYLNFVKAGKASEVASDKQTYLRNFFVKKTFPAKINATYTRYYLGFPATSGIQYLTRFEKKVEEECLEIVAKTEKEAGDRLVGLFG